MIRAIILGIGTFLAFILGGYLIFVTGPNMVEETHATTDAPLLIIILGFVFMIAGLGLATLAVKALDDDSRTRD